MTVKMPCPTEEAEQAALIRWAMYEEGKWPELGLLYHVPNEGKRTKMTGGKLRMVGMRKGVPDLCLPVARGMHYGLYVEMKRRDGSTPTQDQADWLEKLDGQGYCVCWCRGWDAAAAVITAYIKTGKVRYSPTRGRAGKYHATEEQE